MLFALTEIFTQRCSMINLDIKLDDTMRACASIREDHRVTTHRTAPTCTLVMNSAPVMKSAISGISIIQEKLKAVAYV